MKFEYYINKSLTNKVKHGIDFIEAQEPWNNELLTILQSPHSSAFNEDKFLYVGKIQNKFWTVIATCRNSKANSSYHFS